MKHRPEENMRVFQKSSSRQESAIVTKDQMKKEGFDNFVTT
jgi:hypothetical protein